MTSSTRKSYMECCKSQPKPKNGKHSNSVVQTVQPKVAPKFAPKADAKPCAKKYDALHQTRPVEDENDDEYDSRQTDVNDVACDNDGEIQINRKMEETNTPDDIPISIDDFEEMDFLSDKLFSGICNYGFKYPSQIQAKSIHIIHSGIDLIAQSQSGTGKTGAFTIGALSRINPNEHNPQIIILSHCRPLACQTLKVVEKISMYMNVTCCLCVGGTSTDNAKLVSSSQILIGTPGRLSEFVTRQIFDGNKIKTFIIDEADELMKHDFRKQMIKLVNYMGPRTQICVFSATYTRDALQLTQKFLNNPFKITIEKEDISLEKVVQYKIEVQYDANKPPVLEDLLRELVISQVIVFANSTKSATNLRNTLMKHGFEPALIHGKLKHDERENILIEFRKGRIRTLISTDVMCRGIDVDDLRIVINYDIALDPETYIHRIGRSGRFGAQGIAINLCTYDDFYRLRIIQRQYGVSIEDMPLVEEVNEILTGMVEPKDKIKSSVLYDDA